MKANWISFLLLIMFAGCSKDKEPKESPRTALDLLTGNIWQISAAGFDDNKNGVVDGAENVMTPCSADNTYRFFASGKGSIADNELSCGNPADAEFIWSFEEGETRLKINAETNFILRLTENELVLSPDWPWFNVKFLLEYKPAGN